MSLSAQSATQLGLYGQLAIAFAGFAGVIGAFTQIRMPAAATIFRVRSMVTLAVVEMLFSLLPFLIAAFGADEATTWRIACAILAVTGTVLGLIFGRWAFALRRAGHLPKRAYALAVAATLVMIPLYAVAFGFGFATAYAAAFYFGQLFFGMILCAYQFVMLIVAARVDGGNRRRRSAAKSADHR